MRPDATKHRPEPAYLRSLAESIGVPRRELARLTGIERRRLDRILDGTQVVRYPEQWVLECLAAPSAYLRRGLARVT